MKSQAGQERLNNTLYLLLDDRNMSIKNYSDAYLNSNQQLATLKQQIQDLLWIDRPFQQTVLSTLKQLARLPES